jgi:N-formylglutamate deformylase
MSDWLSVRRGNVPLILTFPHTGTELPPDIASRVVSPWIARKDADWWIDRLYAFAAELDATMVHTAISRTVIDVNRDPSGVTLYPGQVTTGLCPDTTFDGEPLFLPGKETTQADIEARRVQYFMPFHAALAGEIERLQAKHPAVVIYDCHSIRSSIPRMFEGELPVLNIGTNNGTSCAPALEQAVERLCADSSFSRVLNGRFRGGWITRQYGQPDKGIHVVQMELCCRGYMREPPWPVTETTWPTPFDETYAAPIHAVLRRVIKACLDHAQGASTRKA